MNRCVSSLASGVRLATIAASRSAVGCSTTRSKLRRRSGSPSFLSWFEVRKKCGIDVAWIVPSFGIAHANRVRRTHTIWRRFFGFLPLLPRSVVATASLAGLRESELRGLEWPDYTEGLLAVNRSAWREFVNKPKTRASRQLVPVIPKLATILDQASMHHPSTGVMFHHGVGERMDMDKLAQRVIRPAVEAIGLQWYRWHGFRRGIASNLYALGASDKTVRRVLRHARPHVTKERYIKPFDPSVFEAMERLQATVEMLEQSPAIGQQVPAEVRAKLLIPNRGEMAERLKVAVC